jgi:hypothetical protein
VSLVTALRALGLGALPCLVLGGLTLLFGWRAAVVVPPAAGPPTGENLEARAALLREQLPHDFAVGVAAPFVVVVEGTTEEANHHAVWISERVRRLRATVFDRGPEEIVDVWLFATTASYRAGVRSHLDEWPRTLHGYYAPHRRAVVVNLESGATTLAHELTHPFVEASYPNVPAWLDEGLASLYERARDREEGLESITGPELVRLKRHLEDGHLPSIAALTAGTDGDFYADPRHLSYTQMRYLLMYLEHCGGLESFLNAMRDAPRDSTGLVDLVASTGARSAEELQTELDAFVSLAEPSTDVRHDWCVGNGHTSCSMYAVP